MILISGPNEPQGAHPSPSAPRGSGRPRPRLSSPRPRPGSCPGTHLGPEHQGTPVVLGPSRTPSRSSSPTPCPIPRLCADPAPRVHCPRAPPPSPLRTWAGGVSGACHIESHLRCPQPGGRGRAGRGRDWSTAEPRPRPPPESDPTFSPARAPPPAPLSLRRSVRGPRRRSSSHPLARQPGAPSLAPDAGLPRDPPRPPRSPPRRMRLLPEWLLLLFGPWLLRKVRAAGLQRERRGPGCKGPGVRGAPCARPAPRPESPNFARRGGRGRTDSFTQDRSFSAQVG